MSGTMFASSSRVATLENRVQEALEQLRETRDLAVKAEAKGESHYENCIQHNERVEDMLTEGRIAREEQHRQGQEALQRLDAKFDQIVGLLHERINSLSSRINTIIITMLTTIVFGLAGALYAIFSHKIGLS